MDCNIFLSLFFEWNCSIFLCVNITQTPRVSSPLSLCECHTFPYLFSSCECHTNKWKLCFLLVHHWPILVLTLCGLPHLTSYYFSVLVTHSRSYLVWTATPYFLLLLSFSNITNLFFTTFIYTCNNIFAILGLFLSVSTIYLEEQFLANDFQLTLHKSVSNTIRLVSSITLLWIIIFWIFIGIIIFFLCQMKITLFIYLLIKRQRD